jgi:hypothetical protein
MATAVHHPWQSIEQFRRAGEVSFARPPSGTLAGAKRLDVAIAQKIEQLETVLEIHVSPMIASPAEIL